MKYVAFLDIIGFKDTLKKLSQNEASDYISRFSSTAYQIWNKNNTQGLTGCIISDSFIIYTENTHPSSLNRLMNIIDLICKEEFTRNSILIRGGLAKGDFEQIPTKDFNNFTKELIVGQAYIDAYMLEGTSKSFGISIEENVYNDLENCNYNTSNIVENKALNKYIIRYLDIDYLLKNDNLRSFVKLAKESKWLPHYYNSIAYAIKNEENKKKVDELFYSIIDYSCDSKTGDNYLAIDMFIEKAFAEEVDTKFKKRILRFIRQSLTNRF